MPFVVLKYSIFSIFSVFLLKYKTCFFTLFIPKSMFYQLCPKAVTRGWTIHFGMSNNSTNAKNTRRCHLLSRYCGFYFQIQVCPLIYRASVRLKVHAQLMMFFPVNFVPSCDYKLRTMTLTLEHDIGQELKVNAKYQDGRSLHSKVSPAPDRPTRQVHYPESSLMHKLQRFDLWCICCRLV